MLTNAAIRSQLAAAGEMLSDVPVVELDFDEFEEYEGLMGHRFLAAPLAEWCCRRVGTGYEYDTLYFRPRAKDRYVLVRECGASGTSFTTSTYVPSAEQVSLWLVWSHYMVQWTEAIFRGNRFDKCIAYSGYTSYDADLRALGIQAGAA